MNRDRGRRVEESPQIANLDAERWVLGLCLLSEGTRTVTDSRDALDHSLSQLKPADFSLSKHQEIFRVLSELHAAGITADAVNVCQKLIERGSLERVDGVAYIASLSDGMPRGIDVERYCEIVSGFSRRRTIACWARQIELTCMDPAATAEDLSVLLELPEEAHGGRNALQPIGAVVRERLAEIRSSASAPEKLPGWTAGIADLDSATTGIRPSELWVIGAIPGAGKTSLLAQILLANAKAGVPVGIFSAEMSAKGIVDRLLSMDSGLALPKFRNPRSFSAAELNALGGHCREIIGLPIVFDETPGIELPALRARAKLMARKHGCRLFAVDFLQLVEAEGDNRRERVAAVARGLKNLAKELDAGVIAASQLSRPQKNAMAPPTMLDLKESGDIEAAADTVILIYRPFVLSHNASDRDRDALIISKQRNGPVGDIRVVFDEAHTRFLAGGVS
jgi:replicative DNA helicase